MKISEELKSLHVREEHLLWGVLGLVTVIHLVACPLIIAHVGIGQGDAYFFGNGALGVLCVFGGTALFALIGLAVENVTKKRTPTHDKD